VAHGVGHGDGAAARCRHSDRSRRGRRGGGECGDRRGGTAVATDGCGADHRITAATEADAEQIILAGGRRSPLGKIQLDRLTQYVVLNAPMTVTLVR
jgi:hypothetical protein